MDKIRAELRDFIATEQSLRDQRATTAHDTVLASLWLTGGMVVLLGGGLALLSRRQLAELVGRYEAALLTARESTVILEHLPAFRTCPFGATAKRGDRRSRCEGPVEGNRMGQFIVIYFFAEGLSYENPAEATADRTGRFIPRWACREKTIFANVVSHP